MRFPAYHASRIIERMNRIWLTALIGALVTPALLFVACSDDDDSTPSPAASTSTRPAASPTARPSSAASQADGPLAELLDKLDDATYRAEYDISGSFGGNVSGKGVLAGRPPARLFDFDGRTSLGIDRFVIIETGSEYYLCLETQGQKNCAKDNAAAGLQLPTGLSVDEIFSSIALDPGTSSTEVEGRKIAGRDARCFDVAGVSASGLLCAADNGVPLHFEGTFNGARWQITATKVGEPSDADFEPPFDIVG